MNAIILGSITSLAIVFLIVYALNALSGLRRKDFAELREERDRADERAQDAEDKLEQAKGQLILILGASKLEPTERLMLESLHDKLNEKREPRNA